MNSMKYAKIIDSDACVALSDMSYDGIPASFAEWEKYDFFPQEGMVGELIDNNGHALLRIFEGRGDQFVPIKTEGYEIISQNEFTHLCSNNIGRGIPFTRRLQMDQEDAVRSEKAFTEKAAQMHPFGVEYDKQNLCHAFKKALAFLIQNNPQHPNIYDQIDMFTREMKQNDLSSWSYLKTIQMLSRWIVFKSNLEGFDRNDINGIVWMMGMEVKAYRKALGTECTQSFDEIFQDLYEYFMNNILNYYGTR